MLINEFLHGHLARGSGELLRKVRCLDGRIVLLARVIAAIRVTIIDPAFVALRFESRIRGTVCLDSSHGALAIGLVETMFEAPSKTLCN